MADPEGRWWVLPDGRLQAVPRDEHHSYLLDRWEDFGISRPEFEQSWRDYDTSEGILYLAYQKGAVRLMAGRGWVGAELDTRSPRALNNLVTALEQLNAPRRTKLIIDHLEPDQPIKGVFTTVRKFLARPRIDWVRGIIKNPKTQIPKGQIEYRKPGQQLWFEYHCFESPESGDAPVWFRSHNKVTVLKLVEPGFGKTQNDRAYNGESAIYSVRFPDGLEWDAFEDELLDSKKDFFRPDPPKQET